jgi:Molecular chaperone (small heat shock protein)
MNAVDRSFWDDFFGEDLLPVKFGSFKTDITENDKEYVIEADLPGFAKEAIQLEMTDNRLTISAKKDDAVEENKDNYIRKERYVGEVSRTFIVDDVKEEDIKAEFKDGVVKVILPKKEPAANRIRKIDLN